MTLDKGVKTRVEFSLTAPPIKNNLREKTLAVIHKKKMATFILKI